jgi:hypothetical protein
MIRKKVVMGRMVARIRADVDKPERDSFDDEFEEGGGEVEVEVGVEEEEEEDGVVEGAEAVDDTEEVGDMAVLAEVGEAVIGIGIIGGGVDTPVEVEVRLEATAEVLAPPPSPSVLLGSSGTPAVGIVAGEVEPPNVHPSPRGMDGP